MKMTAKAFSIHPELCAKKLLGRKFSCKMVSRLIDTVGTHLPEFSEDSIVEVVMTTDPLYMYRKANLAGHRDHLTRNERSIRWRRIGRNGTPASRPYVYVIVWRAA